MLLYIMMKDELKCCFIKKVRGIAPGQSAAIYEAHIKFNCLMQVLS